MRHLRPGRQLPSVSEVPGQRAPDYVICGVNAVQEALRVGSRRLKTIWVAKAKGGQRLQKVLALAAESGTPVEVVPESRLTACAGTSSHQGIVAVVVPTALLTFDALITKITSQHPTPPLVILDGVKDPRNLGAIIRSAAAFGVGGIVIPKHRSAGITATVAKAASGGLEYVPVTEVTNISRSIEHLKHSGFWIVGTDEQAEAPCHRFQYPLPLALVFGEEGIGISSLVKRCCDMLVRIPVNSPLRSLNVAVAAAVLFYEVLGRRGGGNMPPTPPTSKTSSL